MHSRADHYRHYATTCSATDYGSASSVRRHNDAVDAMRSLAAEPGATGELSPLLDEPECARWLAFQLLESTDPSPPVAERCLAIIRRMADSRGVDAMGAREWLREHGGETA
jgi:hypothetical protein